MGLQMGKYRSVWCMSSRNHNILYYLRSAGYLFGKWRNSAVENSGGRSNIGAALMSFAPSNRWKSVSLRRPRLRRGAPLHKAQRWCNLCAGVCKIRKRGPGAFALATYDRNAEKGPIFLRRFHLVLLRIPDWIIVAPQPEHRFRKLRQTLRGVMGAFAKTEVEIVPL